MLLDYAAKCGGVVVSRDNYRDLIGVSSSTAPVAWTVIMGQEPPAGTVLIGMELHRQELC